MAVSPGKRRASKHHKELSDHPVRRLIVESLDEDPGANVAEVARLASLSRNAASHHLYLLESAGIVRSVVDGRERHFFLRGTDPRLRSPLLALRKAHAEDIARFVREHPGTTRSVVAKRLAVPRKTTASSLERLVNAGILLEKQEGSARAYYPTQALQELLELRSGDTTPKD